MKRAKTTGAEQSDAAMFVTWDEGDAKGRRLAMASAARGIEKVADRMVMHHSQAQSAFYDSGTNVSIRNEYNRRDYEAYRPSERMPRTNRELVARCMQAVDNCGLVSNIVNIMSEFTVQGAKLIHPNPGIERWHNEWWNRIGGYDRSERMANLLYKAANVVVRRHVAKIKVKDEDAMRQGLASQASDDQGGEGTARADNDWEKDVEPPFKLGNRTIPWDYTLMNPLQMEVQGGDLATLIGPEAFVYSVQIPEPIIRTIKMPATAAEKQLVAQLPQKLRQAVKDGARSVPLSSNDIQVLYYKKDDWQVWARPMVAPLLKDIEMYEKLKLADISALDGAISHVRIWRLGSLEHRIMPTEAAISRLADMLLHNVGSGSIDLVWGPEIDLLETKTDVYRFLGDTKYGPTLTAIYAGLGIPPMLTGASTERGFTTNWISLKTLTERLQYVRKVIAAFWRYELRLLQQAMGFRFPAQVTFDRMVLTDESAEKALLIQLADRDLISWETILERWGEDPIVEKYRMKRDVKGRDSGQMPPKASPFHDPQQQEALQKIFAQHGSVAPSQLGLDLPPKKPGEQTPVQHIKKNTPTPPPAAPADGNGASNAPRNGRSPSDSRKGQPGQGRPKNSKDTKQRQRRTERPRTAAFLKTLCWVQDAQRVVAEVTTPAYLKSLAKANLRQLTEQEAQKFENFKFAVLCNLPLDAEVNRVSIGKVVTSTESPRVPVAVRQLTRATLAKYRAKEGGEPPLDTLRRIQAGAYALYIGDYDSNEPDASPRGDGL